MGKKRELTPNEIELEKYEKKLKSHESTLSELQEKLSFGINGDPDVDVCSVISQINNERALIKSIDRQITDIKIFIEPCFRVQYENEFKRKYA